MAGRFPPAPTAPPRTAPTGATPPQRRIRQHARDTLAVAAFSLGASAAATVVIWAVLWALT